MGTKYKKYDSISLRCAVLIQAGHKPVETSRFVATSRFLSSSSLTGNSPDTLGGSISVCQRTPSSTTLIPADSPKARKIHREFVDADDYLNSNFSECDIDCLSTSGGQWGSFASEVHAANQAFQEGVFCLSDYRLDTESDTSVKNVCGVSEATVRRFSSTSANQPHSNDGVRRSRFGSESGCAEPRDSSVGGSGHHTGSRPPSRSASQISLEEVVIYPQSVPNKLDFSQLEKFEGIY